MNVSNVVTYPVGWNAPAPLDSCSSCETGNRTSSDSDTVESSSAGDKSDTSVAKLYVEKTAGLTRPDKKEDIESSASPLARTRVLSQKSLRKKSFSQFDSNDVTSLLAAETSNSGSERDKPFELTGVKLSLLPQPAETPEKVHLIPLKRGKELDEISPGVPDRLKGLPKLGEGSYGRVYFVNKTVKGVGKGALKQFLSGEGGFSERQHRQASREVFTHIELDHNNIAKALGYLVNQQSVMLLMEALSGDLEQYVMESDGSKDLASLLHIMEGVFRGVGHLHKDYKLLHGDLKLKNILLNDQGVAKITDFGFASEIDKPRTLASEPPCFYMAPELTSQQREHMSEKTDVFCLGFIALQLLKDERLFHAWVNKPNLTKENFSYSSTLYQSYCRYFEHTDTEELSKVNGKPVVASVLDVHKIAGKRRNNNGVSKKNLEDFIQNMVFRCMSHSPDDRLSLTEAKGFLVQLIKQLESGGTTKRIADTVVFSVPAKKKLCFK